MTCKTHHECVKLIKKTGDTLALKVYTSPNAKSLLNSGSNNFASTSIVNGTIIIPPSLNSSLSSKSSHQQNSVYQLPQQILLQSNKNNIYSQQSTAKSYSYYATSTIAATASVNYTDNYTNNQYVSEIQNRADLNALFLDGTKSLPSKKKRKSYYLDLLILYLF